MAIGKASDDLLTSVWLETSGGDRGIGETIVFRLTTESRGPAEGHANRVIDVAQGIFRIGGQNEFLVKRSPREISDDSVGCIVVVFEFNLMSEEVSFEVIVVVDVILL